MNPDDFNPAPTKKRFSLPRISFGPHTERVLIAILVAATIVSAGYSLGRASVFNQYPGLASAVEASQLIDRVNRLMQLPTDESPSIAVINDAAQAKASQPFLVNAADGDDLIVYANAHLAILYRPSADRIISVGPVYAQDDTTTPGSTPVAPTTSKDDAKSDTATTTP